MRGVELESDASYANGTIAGADLLTIGSDGTATVAGLIMSADWSHAADQDVFSLGAVAAGKQVELNVRLPASSSLAPRVTLLDSAGNLVADTDGNPGDGHFKASVPAGGDYYAKVESYRIYGGHAYLPTAEMTWSDAEGYAQSIGGHLVTINDEAEQWWLGDEFFCLEEVWIGLNDPEASGAWAWSSGETGMTFTWAASEPTPGDTVASMSVYYPYEWSGDVASSTMPGIVEMANPLSQSEGGPGPMARYLLDVQVTDAAPEGDYADLQASDVRAQPVAVTGQPTTVTWTVTNQGAGTTSDGPAANTVSSWTDRIVFSPNATFGDGDDVLAAEVPHSGATAPAEHYDGAWTGAVPGEVSGEYHVFVAADVGDAVFESPDACSNVAESAGTIQVAWQAFADLAIADPPTVEGATVVGASITVSWHVANTANAWADAPDATWWDKLILSTDDIYGNGDDVMLDYATHVGSVPVGGGYDDSISVTIPSGYIGTAYLFAVADGWGSVNEFIYEDNNVSPPREIDITGADLVTEDVTPAETTAVLSGPLQVTWTVRNQGTAPAAAIDWYDTLYLSRSPTFDATASAVIAWSTGYNQDQPPLDESGGLHDSYTATATITIPTSFGTGDCYLFVKADNYYTYGNNWQGETDETNNLSAGIPITVVAPDLVAESVTLSATMAVPNGPLTVTWTVRNQGTVPAPAPAWCDTVYLSRSETFDSTAYGVALQWTIYNADQPPLDASGGDHDHYTATTTITIPADLGTGDFYLFVQADDYYGSSNNWQGETDETNNASVVGVPIALGAADLQVTDLALDPPSPWSGDSVTVHWKDANAGNGTTPSGFYDRVVVTLTHADETTETLLSQDYYFHEPVAAGDSADRQASFLLPGGEDGAGTIAVTVTADVYGWIPEYIIGTEEPAEGNNVAELTAGSTLRTDVPDLVVDSVAIDPSGPESGDQVTVRWRDRNQGIAATGGSWTDSITVVNAATGATLVNQARVGYDSSTRCDIPPGEFRDQSYTFTLPHGDDGAGSLLVTITTDADDDVFEFSTTIDAEANNTTAGEFTSTLAAYPDLVVTSVGQIDSALPGRAAVVSWTVQNQGSADAAGDWVDRVFLSPSPTDSSAAPSTWGRSPSPARSRRRSRGN